MAQESVKAFHSPQHLTNTPTIAWEIQNVPRKRHYDKLKKAGIEDFKGTTDPLEAKKG